MTHSVEQPEHSAVQPQSAAPIQKPSKPTRSWLSWLGHVGGAVALLALVFSLFGLGVVVGLATLFNLHPGMFVASAFDLLMACWAAILVGFNGLTQASFGRLIVSAYAQWWPVALACSVAVLVYAIVKGRRFASWAHWRARFAGWVASHPTNLKERTVGAALGVIFLWLWPAIAALAGWAFMMLSLSLVTIVPLLGYGLGQAAGQAFVVKPEGCTVSRSRAQLLNKQSAADGAACVVITGMDQGKPTTQQGRVILSTGSYVLLFDAASGIATRVPTGDRVIRSWSASDKESGPMPPSSSFSSPAAPTPINPDVAPPRRTAP